MLTPPTGEWTRQPPVGTPLRRTHHSLLRGLALAVIPPEREWFTQAFPVLSGGALKTNGGWGRCAKTPATQISGNYIYSFSSGGLPGSLPAAFDCTLLVLHRCTTNNTPSVFALELNSAEPISLGATGNLMRFRTASNSTSDIALTNGANNCIVGIKRVNSNELYLNGVLMTTAVTGNRTVDPIGQLSVGRPSGVNLENVEYSLLLYWQRALSLAQVRLISLNPWQLFQPTPTNIWASVSGAATFNAAWATGANTTIQPGAIQA